MKKVLAFLALALAAVALVACGGGNDNSTSSTQSAEGGAAESGSSAEGASAGGAKLDFEADPGGELAFTTTSMKGKAGKVTIDFNNPSALTHDVAIEDSTGKTIAQTDEIAEGSDSTTTELEPGEYTFYCTVPGHRDAGMEGTLTVE
jgi:plastocyanin